MCSSELYCERVHCVSARGNTVYLYVRVYIRVVVAIYTPSPKINIVSRFCLLLFTVFIMLGTCKLPIRLSSDTHICPLPF